jgi:hypothetical protein
MKIAQQIAHANEQFYKWKERWFKDSTFSDDDRLIWIAAYMLGKQQGENK